MDKYLNYFHTLKHMKAKQINYRLFYMLRSKYRKLTKFSYFYKKASKSERLNFIKSIESYDSFKDGKFEFLNLSYEFENEIDWNYLGYGKLWAYNLNYFEFLNQKDFDCEMGLKLIDDFISSLKINTEGLEPFPISLRGINWIKFLSQNKIKNQEIDDSLYAQYMILIDNLEYHLLGNHLLENGFSLLFGAYYFKDKELYVKAKEILTDELDEQILEDGAHFELTPMYHQIMLFRVLDSLNLVANNEMFDKELEELFIKKSKMMLSWLKKISYKDGTIPHFNDSTDRIAPTSINLFEYAKRLGLENLDDLELSESGYRAKNFDKYELRVDVGEIGPSYIPGHAHSDTFSFELRVDGKPFIVDSGISTYESNELRLKQRETSAHNTVQIGDIEQSKVWSSFRVANRANISFLKEYDDTIIASHDGYKDLGVTHQRTFTASGEVIEIKDLLIGKYNAGFINSAYIHFHPDIDKIEIKDDKVIIKDIILLIKGSKNLQLDDFTYAYGFNRLKGAKLLKITFDNELLVNISFL